jgi:acetyl esterase
MNFSAADNPSNSFPRLLRQNIFCILPKDTRQIEIFRHAISTFIRFFKKADISVQVAELDVVCEFPEAATVIGSSDAKLALIKEKTNVNFIDFDELSKNNISKELCIFIDRMGWHIQKTFHNEYDNSISMCDRLEGNSSTTFHKLKPVWVYAGSLESLQATLLDWLPAINTGIRVLFVANAIAEQLRLNLLAAGINLSQSHIYVAELIPQLDDKLSKEIFSECSNQSVVENELFWNILAALDIAINVNISVSQFMRKLRFVRCDADGLSQISFGSGLSKAIVAPDFATILTARQIVTRKVGHTLVQDRTAAVRWVKNFAGSISQQVEVSIQNHYLRTYRPNNANGRHLIYLHGGGLVYYDLDTFAPFMSQIAALTGFTVLAFGYDKCPETAVEIALDELFERMKESVPESQKSIIMGDSIGGLLALYATVGPLFKKFSQAVLIYPVFSLNETYPSYETYGENYLLDASTMRWFRSLCSPYFKQRGFDPMKLSQNDLEGLRLSVFSAGCDVLADEADVFTKLVSADHYQFPEMPHDFCLYGGKIASTQAPITAILNTLTKE